MGHEIGTRTHMTYVLIIIGYSYAGYAAGIQFDNQAACENARSELAKLSVRYSVCVPQR